LEEECGASGEWMMDAPKILTNIGLDLTMKHGLAFKIFLK